METSNCAACAKAVGHGPQCSTCKFKFHFGCASITERGFNRLGSGRDCWLCPSCRDKEASSSRIDESLPGSANTRFSSGLPLELTSTPKSSTLRGDLNHESQSVRDVLMEISSKIAVLQSQFSAIQNIQTDLKQVTSDIAEMKQTLSSRMDEISNRLESLEERVATLESTKTELEALKSVVGGLVDDSVRNEQWVRRSNIQLNGIPQRGGENLFAIVEKLSSLSGFKLNVDTDIDFVTRVAVKNDIEDKKRPKPIILKLQSRYKKDDFLAALRKLKDLKARDLGFLDSNSRVYINDHLSARNKYLLKQARTKSKEKGYSYCWVRNCTVMVRRTENSPVLHVTSEEDLKKII